jgi:ankyrin repeat protein
MTKSLPAKPSLENLKKQAKTLQKAWHAGGAEALARVRAAHPQYALLSDERLRAIKPRLTDCQLVLAREAGFESWPQVKAAIQATNRELADGFVELACLCYDDPHYDHRSFHVRAHEMLRQNPSLAEANIWSAASAGNAAAVGAFLEKQPDLVNRPGPHGWAPLICACYSRVQPLDPAHSTLDVAALLLECGANPNAYTMKGNADERLDQTARRFTALTGLFGGGSTGLANQPPHPHWREMAELLLERGANAADEESLAINPGACLEIFLRHGLKPNAMAAGGITLMGRELCRAARQGHRDRVQLLLAHGARTDENLEGKTAWQYAIEQGHLEIVRLLEAAGAPAAELNEVQRFVSLCMAGDERGARTMLERIPDLRERAPQNMVQKAVGTERKEAVNLVLDLGFDPNAVEDNAAIHQAGTLARNEEILQSLLRRGASLTLRDPWYDGTAIEWANFFNYIDLRDKLLSLEGICLFDALEYDRLERVPEILARDPAALERPFAKCLSREPKPEDWQTPLVRMVVHGKTEAVRILLSHGADPAVRHPDGRSLWQVAREQGLEEIASLLESKAAGRRGT